MGREDWTKGVVGGDAVLREVAKYVGELRGMGITKVDDIATELESKFGANFHPTFITSKQFKALSKSKKASKTINSIQDLDNLIAANPNKKMKFGGVKNDKSRADLLAYLAEQK